MLYSQINPDPKRNRYMLDVLTIDGKVITADVLPRYFDDLTYTPLGIEFKIKSSDARGVEEALAYFIPAIYCGGFGFAKNPNSDDARKGMRYDRLE